MARQKTGNEKAPEVQVVEALPASGVGLPDSLRHALREKALDAVQELAATRDPQHRASIAGLLAAADAMGEVVLEAEPQHDQPPVQAGEVMTLQQA